MPGPPRGAFVADDDNVSRMNGIAENAIHGIFLAFKYPGFAGKSKNAFVYPGGLHDAAVFGQVAVQHRKAAILAVGVLSRSRIQPPFRSRSRDW